MSFGVVYALEASNQLEELFFYIAERRSPAVADSYTGAVVAACERLALLPLRGGPRDYIRPGLRVGPPHGRTAIAYATDADARTVSILGVFYGGQDY